MNRLSNHFRGGRWWFVYAAFPIAAVLSQFYWRTSFWGIAIITGLLALTVIAQRPLNLILVWEACLIIVLFTTSTAVTWLAVAYIGQDTIRYISQVEAKLNAPNSGLEVLPKESQQALSLIQAHQLSDYRLSPQLQNPYLSQRIMEATWPIKREADSANYLYLVGEPLDDLACRELDRRDHVALADCH